MADGRHVGKKWKYHNSTINGPIEMKRGWSHPIMFSTSQHAPSNGALNIQFLSTSLYFSKEALIEIGCVVTSLVGCHVRALWPNGAS